MHGEKSYRYENEVGKVGKSKGLHNEDSSKSFSIDSQHKSFLSASHQGQSPIYISPTKEHGTRLEKIVEYPHGENELLPCEEVAGPIRPMAASVAPSVIGQSSKATNAKRVKLVKMSEEVDDDLEINEEKREAINDLLKDME